MVPMECGNSRKSPTKPWFRLRGVENIRGLLDYQYQNWMMGNDGKLSYLSVLVLCHEALSHCGSKSHASLDQPT